ncbi:MAG: HEAT repeat domain-containing protein [Phycisphaerae bacterium]
MGRGITRISSRPGEYRTTRWNAIGHAGHNGPEDRIDRLGKEKSETSRKQLIELTANSDRNTALSAVRNLGLQGDEESRRALEAVLADPDRDSRVRSAAAATLGRFEEMDPQPLTRILANEEDVHVRRGAARGLMKWTSTKNNQAVPDLYKALRDPDVRVREAAATALYKATLMLSMYDPRKDPRTQGKQLSDIRRMLTEKGYLK